MKNLSENREVKDGELTFTVCVCVWCVQNVLYVDVCECLDMI